VPNQLSLSGAGAGSYQYTQKVIALAPIAYWPLADLSGSTAVDESGNGRNGTYSNVTLGQPGIGDGRTGASFNGTTSYVDVSAARTAFNGNEGTLAGWIRITSVGVWTDATFREFVRFLADGSNIVLIDKSSTNNGVRFSRTGGGTNKVATDTSLAGTLGWFHVAMTWSKSADQQIHYINGVQVGATLTGLGTFSGTPAVTTSCLGNASTTTANVHSGNLGQWALWATPLSAAQILALATVPS